MLLSILLFIVIVALVIHFFIGVKDFFDNIQR